MDSMSKILLEQFLIVLNGQVIYRWKGSFWLLQILIKEIINEATRICVKILRDVRAECIFVSTIGLKVLDLLEMTINHNQ